MMPLRHSDGRPVEFTDQQAPQAREICRVFDVPPWLIGVAPRPRFARLRWWLRKVWPL